MNLCGELLGRLRLERGSVARGVLALSEHCSFEILKSYHDHCHIIQRLPIERVLKHCFHCQTRLLVHVLGKFLVLIVDVDTVPYTIGDIFIRELVEDTVTAKYDEIVLFLNFECVDIWLANHYFWITPSKFKFGLRVPKSP